jgi:hypothetical protein
MNTKAIKKVILTIVIAVLFIVPVSIVALTSSNNKSASAYNPYAIFEGDDYCRINGYNVSNPYDQCYKDLSKEECQKVYSNSVYIGTKNNYECKVGYNLQLPQPKCSKSNEYLVNGKCIVRNSKITPKYDNSIIDYSYTEVNKIGYDIFGNKVNYGDFNNLGDAVMTYSDEYKVDKNYTNTFDFDCSYGYRKEYYDSESYSCVQEESFYEVNYIDDQGSFYGDPINPKYPIQDFDLESGYYNI